MPGVMWSKMYLLSSTLITVHRFFLDSFVFCVISSLFDSQWAAINGLLTNRLWRFYETSHFTIFFIADYVFWYGSFVSLSSYAAAELEYFPGCSGLCAAGSLARKAHNTNRTSRCLFCLPTVLFNDTDWVMDPTKPDMRAVAQPR